MAYFTCMYLGAYQVYQQIDAKCNKNGESCRSAGSLRILYDRR